MGNIFGRNFGRDGIWFNLCRNEAKHQFLSLSMSPLSVGRYQGTQKVIASVYQRNFYSDFMQRPKEFYVCNAK